MSFVLSLIAAQPKERLDRHDLERARACLETCGADAAESAWLSPFEACDIAFDAKAETSLPALRQAFSERAIDVNIVPAATRRKKLLLADMDSTLIEQECIDELAAEAGVVAEVAALTEQAMRGEIAFEPALRARVALLGGLPVGMIQQVLSSRISLMPGAATLVATMRAAGAYTALVSGGFTAFTGPIADRLGFNEHRANLLGEEDGVLTGMVAEPILGRAGKQEALTELTGRLQLRPAETLAVGDGANDIGMISQAGLGVAFRAKPALRAAADAIIDHADLTAVLFLQGFRKDEFVSAQDEVPAR
jgi:phosphoserine phosphatase